MARSLASASARGYGRAHQKVRAALLAAWQPGDPCTRCGKPMWGPPSRIHLGHTDDRAGYRGLEHASCNTADGARRGNQQRTGLIIAAGIRALECKICGKEYHYAAKQCMICGRHYHPNRKVQYTCSRPCGVAFKRLTYSTINGVIPAPKPACEFCGKPCPYLRRRTCSQDCADKLRVSRRRTLTCQQCGKGFPGQTAKYCSQNCQSLAYYYDHREERLAYARDHSPEPAERALRRGAQLAASRSRAW